MITKRDGMAWGGEVSTVAPIDGADNIQRAEVVCGRGGRWSCVVGKEVTPGDRLVVFLPDSIVPERPETAFMEKHGWRVRMMRLRGCPSEVLALKMDVEFTVGDDLTHTLGVMKHEKEIPACLSGTVVEPFPWFIPKTDEPNFQSVPEMVADLEGRPYYASVKYDGSSQTVFKHKGEFGACSRNWKLAKGKRPAVWQLVERHDLERLLPDGFALQWECVGPGIQGNRLRLSQIDLRLFSVFDINDGSYWGLSGLREMAKTLDLPMVDVIEEGIWTAKSDDELRQMAQGKYRSGNEREGIVIRVRRGGFPLLSFKVINLRYKEFQGRDSGTESRKAV